jgi:1,2-phenylacetyl-CoA epoxidase catalytic subunit
MFGRSAGKRQHRYVYYRLKKRGNEERRQAFIETVGAELEAMGLTAPDPMIGRSFI